ncbi:hypothetical protein BHE74_00037674 [Ensete ventricosum]|nr:hypothetical protein BHE74_00037674 [Ensete ventricosum]
MTSLPQSTTSDIHCDKSHGLPLAISWRVPSDLSDTFGEVLANSRQAPTASGATAKSTLKIWYGRFSHRPGQFNHRQPLENLGDDSTTTAHQRFSCRNFRKSGSLHFSNSNLNLILSNPMVNQLSST